MPFRIQWKPVVLAAAGLCAMLGAPNAEAQDAGHRHSHVRKIRPAPDASVPVTFRGLTINRAPDDDEQDIYQDGPIRYNDIQDFSPAPYVTSGVQFPYGFDGIGGYGSDLGFGAGQDSALYDRGAGAYRTAAP